MTSRWIAVGVLAGLVTAGAAADQVTDRDGSGATGAEVVAASEVTAGTAVSSAWYCAAGAADGGPLDHVVALTNITDETISATVTVHAEEGEPVVVEVAVGAGGSELLRLAEVVEAEAAAALVELPGDGLLVEHRLGDTGAAASACASTTSSEWYVAWGTTARDATETLFLYNPQSNLASVDITFETDEGDRDPGAFEGFVVPGRSVRAVNIGGEVNRRDLVAATIVARSGRIVVERVQQFDGSEGRRGVATSLGTPAPATTWLFADGGQAVAGPTTAPEGEPPDIELIERVVVHNPSDREAVVIVDVQTPGVEPFERTVRADSVVEVETAGSTRVPPDVGYGITVTSENGIPIVAERVRTDPVRGDVEVTTGVTAPWETLVAGAGGEGSTLVLYNPTSESVAQVNMQPLGSEAADSFEIEPNGQERVELTVAVVVQATLPVVGEIITVGDGVMRSSPALPLVR